MKVSISFFFMTILTTIFVIISVSFYGANQAYYTLQKRVEEVSIKLQNADFNEQELHALNKANAPIKITKENDYIYHIDAPYSYDIAILFFQDDRTMHNVLYRGGW